jgi:heavy metal translocating P-type ATPase
VLAELCAIAVGGLLHLVGLQAGGDAVWAASVLVMLVPLCWSVVRVMVRGRVGVDLIALIAIVGALILGQYLAGAVVSLMLAGGNALEDAATRRARRDLTALVQRAPRIAHRQRGKSLEEVSVDELSVGDVVLVRQGELVPVDGRVLSSSAALDESTLSGESLPVTHARGESVRSGSANAGEAFDLEATRRAAESSYAHLVRLVQAAEGQRAPFVRLADRYAAVFLPITLAVAGFAWALSGDPVRGLAVMVVATPCPLILAAPVALISGLSLAARVGVVIKGSSAIETLGRAKTVLLDKTGTVTLGTPTVDQILVTDNEPDSADLLQLAASLEQLSPHVMAEAIVHEAQRRGLDLDLPGEVVESPGEGIEGTIQGKRIAVGGRGWLAQRGYQLEAADQVLIGDEAASSANVLVGVNGRIMGALVMRDQIRDEAAELVERLKRAGIDHVAMVTGDRRDVALAVGGAAGMDEVLFEQTPETKLETVRRIRAETGSPVVMVGDGVNDAPALAVADVGIAMGGAGATISSETADAVITVDQVDRVVAAIEVGRRSLGIATQSVVYGIGLSIVAMLVAALGYLPPVYGALFQEVIDVAVIANALRALRR